MKNYDFVVIGGGAAAFAATIKASEFDVKVAMIESGTLGGTCVNVGCVPTKLLLTAAGKYFAASKNPFKGIMTSVGDLNFAKLVAQKDEIVEGERKAKYADVLKSYPNVTLIKGQASFVNNKEIKVEDGAITADKFLIATGSSAQIPTIDGLDDIDYLTNIEALNLKELPKSMLILGGRALGLEFAQIFARFGTEVTLLQRSPRIIPEQEPQISEALRGYLEDEGIRVKTNVVTKKVGQENGLIKLVADVDDKYCELKAEKLLLATGRKPNTSNLELEKAGVEVDKTSAVAVNEFLQTSCSHIYAAGDVIGQPMLETVAAKAGSVVAHNAFASSPKKMNFQAIPSAIFTDPAVASVGLTDTQAVKAGVKCNCRVVSMDMVPKAKIIQNTKGLIKMVIDNETKQVLGVHILSPLAHELIHEATLAVKFKLTIDDLTDTVHIFPALSESIKLVAQSFKHDLSKMSCCIE